MYRCGKTGEISKTLEDSSRPLALCLGWSNASVKSLSKYAALYATHGDCDAVLLPSKPHLVYSPRSGAAAMASLAKSVAAVDRDVIVCGFSVGAYLYANFLMHLREHPDLGKKVEPRLKGIIFDSPVDFHGVPRGLSRSVVGSDGTLPQKALEALIHAYLGLFKDVATRYKQSSDFLHTHARTDLPSLWLFSSDDFVTTPDDVYFVIRKWQASGHHVTPVEFHGSKHVMHLPTHSADYDAAVKSFFASLNNSVSSSEEEGSDVSARSP